MNSQFNLENFLQKQQILQQPSANSPKMPGESHPHQTPSGMATASIPGSGQSSEDIMEREFVKKRQALLQEHMRKLTGDCYTTCVHNPAVAASANTNDSKLKKGQ